MAALKYIYINGFSYSPSQDQIVTIPLPIDIIGSASQMPSGYPTTDFAWWDDAITPSLLRNGSAQFRGNCEIPTHTSSVTTMRVEHTTSNSLLGEAEEMFWSVSIYTPIGYESDPKYDVIYQWHDIGGSPPLSIRRLNGRLSFNIYTGSGFINQQHMDVGPVNPGEWTHFVVYTKWADDLSGILTVWKDGKLARLYGPDGNPWVVPDNISPGVTTNWIIKPLLGDLPYTVTENDEEVSVLDWRGRISRIGEGIHPDKYSKHGIYKSSITDSYVTGGGLKEGWDNPESEYYIPPESRIVNIGFGNVNFETRLGEITHENIYKSIDVNGEGPQETPDWWIESVSITSPLNGDNFTVGESVNVVTDAEEGPVDLIIQNNLVETKISPPYVFSFENIPLNGAIIDIPFNSNTHQWGEDLIPVIIENSDDVSYETGPRGQAIILGSDPIINNRSRVVLSNSGLLSTISNSFSISFYIKSGFGSGLNPVILSNYEDGLSGMLIASISSGRLEVVLYSIENDPITFRIPNQYLLDSSEFHHYVLVYDGETIRWYYDLDKVHEEIIGDIDISASSDWLINSRNTGGGRQKISISDFRIYDYAIPEEEINKTVEDNFLGQLELKVRRDGITSNPVTINIVEELPTFTITATATTGGQVSGDGECEQNEEVTLTATPDSGYEFVRWEEDSETVSTANPYIFNADEDRVLLAVFQQIEYQLTVTYTAGGTATGSGEYIAGSQVQLTATPNSGYSFVGWYRGGTLISTSNPYDYTTRGQADTVQAVFELIPIPEYTITVIPSTGGTVTGGGTYEEGQSVTLSAMPQSGWTFVKWSNDATDNPYSFTASENLTISAIFEEVNPEVPYIIVKGKFKIV